MKKILSKNKMPLIIIIINFLLIIVVFFTFKQSIDLSSEAQSWKQKTSDLKKAKNTLKNYTEAKIEQERQGLKKVAIGEATPLLAIKEIVNIAQRALIQDIDISQEKVVQTPFTDMPEVKELLLKIRLSCEYNKLIDFLQELRESHALIQVNQLKVIRQEKKLPNLDAVISVSAYAILNKGIKGSESKPLPQKENPIQ